MKRPNLFLFGAPRSGTTQLAHHLASHPMIDLCPIKEPNFFAADDFDPDYVCKTHLDDLPAGTKPKRPVQFAVVRDWNTYLDLFSGTTAHYRLEASTSYLSSPQAAENIAQRCPDARIIILTRDPVDRAVSHYRLARRTGRTRASLDAEISLELAEVHPLCARYILRPSRQNGGVARVFQNFAPARIYRTTFKEYVTNPDAVMAGIAGFLDCTAGGFDPTVQAKNAGAEPRFPLLNAMLYHTGIKTRLRRVMGPQSKHLIKSLWFQDRPAREIVSLTELARLRNLLADEYKDLTACEY